MRVSAWLILLFCILISAGEERAFAQTRECDRRQEWLGQTWGLFNSQRYSEALAVSDACLSEWIAQAWFDQEQLESCPAVGAVSDDVAQSINANGVLNDVGSALWIRARAAHLSGNADLAATYYSQCARLTCSRAWDPQGFFWAPGTNCQARLEGLSR